MTRPIRLCSVEGCDRKHSGLGFCQTHYFRFARHGDPQADKPIRLIGDARIPLHATMNEYSNYGCRCDLCRAAAAKYQKAKREQPCANGCGRMVWNQGSRAEIVWCKPCRDAAATIPIEERHGTEVGYTKGCRCRPCRNASAKARRDRRAALSPEAREADRKRERERNHRRAASMRA